jgi:hypothetical protein
MDKHEYGKLITSIITKLGLGLPLTKEESLVMYEFLLGQNDTIGYFVEENLKLEEKLERAAKYSRRMLAYHKAKNRK